MNSFAVGEASAVGSGVAVGSGFGALRHRRTALRLGLRVLERRLARGGRGVGLAGHELVGRVVLDGGLAAPTLREAVLIERDATVTAALVLVAPARGAEQRLQPGRDLPHRRAGQQEHPEQDREQQQRHRQPDREPVGDRPTRGVAHESGAARARVEIARRTRRQMPESQHRQRNEHGAEHQPRPDLGVRLGAHQRHRDTDHDQREQRRRRAQYPAQRGFDPAADRPAGRDPHRDGDDHAEREQRQRDAVAAMPGVDVACPAHRAGGRADPAGQHRPALSHRATDHRQR